MSDGSSPPREFRQSFALIDSDGKLVDWDSGLEIEWAAARDLIRRGSSYADIVRRLCAGPQIEPFIKANFGSIDFASHIEERISGLGSDRSHEYRTSDGRTIRVQERPTRNGGVQRSARDITEELEAQEQLAHAQNFDAESVGAVTEVRREPNGNYVFPRATEELCRVMNLPPEFIGADPMAIHARMAVTPEETARMGAMFEQSARTLASIRFDFRARDGQDKLKWFRESLIPRREPDGTVIFSGVIRDVTREKRAEDQLELLRNVVVRSSDSIIVMETEPAPTGKTKIIYVNPQFIELFGGSLETLIGKDAEILQTDEASRASARALAAALQKGDGQPIEFRARNRLGLSIWIEARVYPAQKLDDGSHRWVIISRDVSDRRRAEAELLQMKEEAEAASRAKGQFLANMSHELRTPLNAIIGFSELIEQGVERDGWQQGYSEYLHDISASGRHLLTLINTILDLSKIEAGMVTLDLGAVDVDELLVTSVALVSGLATTAGVDLKLIRPSEQLEVDGDYVKLKQVMLNVLSNAIKFTPTGGSVSAFTSITENGIGITVADTGCGISQADLARIAQPFVQVESSLSRKHDGTGLGLSIAKKLCELHGGELVITSTEGKGTTVEIVLPRLIGRIEAAVSAVQERRALPVQ
ncbi:MAG TPA: ATP-binding protein [Alphaproteobacteria bacterium]|nr:ATP-binding protein [Alphaproteobacteria bacterium]